MLSNDALHGTNSGGLLPVSRYLYKSESKSMQRSKLLEILRKRINLIQSQYHEDLAELSFIQAGSRLIDFPSWLRRRSHELMQALCSGHLDSEDLILIGSFMSGVTHPDQFFPPTLSNFNGAGNPSLGDDDSDEDEDRWLDETSIYRIAADEINILKRVADLKEAGVWYGGGEEGVNDGPELGLSATPSMSSLAPPSEAVDRVYKDYLFAELQWLAEDFKRERQWKKVSAKRLAIAAVKSHREKTKRFLKAEREEVLRIRKVCASIARMVRDWWRQMDKIVHAKQQARLTVKHQQAISSHLESVLETTEEYTRWLTEDIAGTQPESTVSQSATESQQSTEVPINRATKAGSGSESSEEAGEMADTHGESVSPSGSGNSGTGRLTLEETVEEEGSDREYKLDQSALEADGDDEETIAREEEEEQEAENPPVKVELDQLAAEADCPLEDLLPPGYLDQVYMASPVSEPSSPQSAVVGSSEGKKDAGKGAETNDDDDDDDCESTAADASAKQLVQAALDAADRPDQPISGGIMDSSTASVPIPFLLSGGTLREYQTVGLTWLATIYNKRLNGILADEMGLGKTIQTIALLAHLACERSIWGPHLIVVPTSVMLNWEMEFKRWCPGFKIITYFGGIKERRERRKGWTKTNAFHVCITSYRLAIQDANVFKRKKWKYLILDEAQNIKNFKSQRWQTLLTFNSQRRLLLTGTPLQNSLMELWSLMHFLMPNIFQSHRDFQEWFASPLTGMLEGNSEFNEQLVERLHKVLRPFLLRRLKADVERQMPKKFEHVIMCRLSRRQRFLYDDFMSRASTCEVLEAGQFLSVMNVLMQLRKVCNHPNLFETRPIVSPFHVADHLLAYPLPRLLVSVSYPLLLMLPPSAGDPRQSGGVSAHLQPDLDWLDRAGCTARLLGQQANVAEMARDLPAFVRMRCQQLGARRPLITAVDRVELTDDVTFQRQKLATLSNSKTSGDDRTVPFWNQGIVDQVNSETFHCNGRLGAGKEYYPRLPEPGNIPPTITKVTPAVRSCDLGMPKAVLRSRTVERQKALALLGRLNERRCHIWTRPHSSGHQKPPVSCTVSWGEDSQLGPDVVHFITRMLRQPDSPTSRPGLYPGLVNGHLVCQHSLFGLFRQESSVYRRSEHWDGTASGSRLSQSLGPEAAYGSRAWCHWRLSCLPLRQLLYTPTDRLDQTSEELKRYTFVVPPAISSGFLVDTSHSYYQSQCAVQCDRLQELFAPVCPAWVATRFLRPSEGQAGAVGGRTRGAGKASLLAPLTPMSWLVPDQLHKITTACRIQFPDPLLIQYDCGKLQRLNLLLQELKAGSHRVLIFSQMARMLDILEQFLAYHGHPYLRLDGTTKVEQRQVLMERFNQDTQIFVFILSTRSGGLGVNLTGADTVIFYDSDWNPTMDAQAQDRCHRIGQTRDVHIYRLISEMTVEENILRKANQKRFLSDVAIEGGRFTTAFFKQNTISELFAEPTGLQDLASKDSDPNAEKDLQPPSKESDSASVMQSKEVDFSALLEVCEEENDRMATKQALDEAKADLAEFDESIPFDSVGNGASGASETFDPFTRFAMTKQQEQQQKSSTANQLSDQVAAGERQLDNPSQQTVEQQLSEFDAALRPIERFAVRMVEEKHGGSLAEQLEMADAHHAESERTWRLDHLKALHEADEGRAEVEEDDILYCYGDYDPTTQLAELARLDRIIAAEEEELQQQQELRQRQREKKQREDRRRHQTVKHGLGTRFREETDAESPGLPFDNTSDSELGGSVSDQRKEMAASAVKRPRYSFASDHEDEDMENIFAQGRPSDEERIPRLSLDHSRKVPSKPRGLPRWHTQRDRFAVNHHPGSMPPVSSLKRPSADAFTTGQPKHPVEHRRPRGRPRLHPQQKRDGHSSVRRLQDFSELDSMPPVLLDRQSYASRPTHFNRQPWERDVGECRKEFTRGYRHVHPFDVPGRTAPTRQSMRGLPPSVGLFRNSLSNRTASPKRAPYMASGAGTCQPSQWNAHQSTVTYPQQQGSPHVNSVQQVSDSAFYSRPAASQVAPPTAAQRPSEPCIPLHSIGNDSHFSLQASHLLSTSGQPVFVITRQMKTPSGEVYHQRFTHPVAPPTQFTRVVHRLVQPTHVPSSIPSVPFTPPCLLHNGWRARPVQTSPVQLTAAAARTTIAAPSMSTSQPLTNLRNLPVMRLEQSPAAGTTAHQQLPPTAAVQPVATDSVPTIPSTPTPTVSPVGVPVIRMISCDSTGTRGTPFVRLAPVETPSPPVAASGAIRQPVVLAGPPLVLTSTSTAATTTADGTVAVASKPHVIRLRRILPAKPAT